MNILSKKTDDMRLLRTENDKLKRENSRINDQLESFMSLEEKYSELKSKNQEIMIDSTKKTERINKLERMISDKEKEVENALKTKILAQEEGLKAKKCLNLREKEIITLKKKNEALKAEIEELIIKNKEVDQ
jgi:hypothetical protein